VSKGTSKWFGESERPLVPPGISGDFTAQAERQYPRASSPELGRRAYFAELADRFQNGAITPEEEAELVEYFSANVAQNPN